MFVLAIHSPALCPSCCWFCNYSSGNFWVYSSGGKERREIPTGIAIQEIETRGLIPTLVDAHVWWSCWRRRCITRTVFYWMVHKLVFALYHTYLHSCRNDKSLSWIRDHVGWALSFEVLDWSTHYSLQIQTKIYWVWTSKQRMIINQPVLFITCLYNHSIKDESFS